MLWYSQTYEYDCEWPVVSLAFLLRYPNPYAAHVLSCDVIDRTWSPTGTLCTTRLILKRGALPRWFPSGVLSRAESWIIEESEVDPFGKTLRCTTRNLDHVKVMQVCESTVLQSGANGYACLTHFLALNCPFSSNLRYSKTSQYTEARVMSNFGWGLAKRIENHGLAKFKANIQRVSSASCAKHFYTSLITTFTLVSRGRLPGAEPASAVAHARNDGRSRPRYIVLALPLPTAKSLRSQPPQRHSCRFPAHSFVRWLLRAP